MRVKAVVEIPSGYGDKYEIDKSDGGLNLDRPLNQVVPENYGFLPLTLSPDSDPLDIFVLHTRPIFPLARVEIEIHSILYCVDNGVSDDKLIGIVVGTEFSTIELARKIDRIKNYLNSYKEGFYIIAECSEEQAIEVYQKSVEAYGESSKK